MTFEDYDKHHAAHPEVADLFCEQAMALLTRTYPVPRKISPWLVVALLRHRQMNRAPGTPKILPGFSNTLLPYYARMAKQRHPELADVLVTSGLGTVFDEAAPPRIIRTDVRRDVPPAKGPTT